MPNVRPERGLSDWNWSHGLKLGLFPMTYLQSLLTQSGYGIPTPCVITLVTDRSCYGCGMMRSLNALWQGEWGLAWHAHRLGIVVWAVLAYLCVQQGILFGSHLYRSALRSRPDRRNPH
ncbi:MAG: DUF2752 domain-containing protein [Holophagaceae bacterium]